MHQVFVEEAQEFQVGIDDSRFRQRTGRTSKRGIKTEEETTEQSPNAEVIKRMMHLYCRCLQHALQVSID